MAVLECSCGMVVSTPRQTAHCIRCGRMLGTRNETPADTAGDALAMPPESNAAGTATIDLGLFVFVHGRA